MILPKKTYSQKMLTVNGNLLFVIRLVWTSILCYENYQMDSIFINFILHLAY
jgi:hypothetical protein